MDRHGQYTIVGLTWMMYVTHPASGLKPETITVHHYAKGDTLKKSTQGSLSVGEYLVRCLSYLDS